ncbi:hypothetical protein AZE42_13498 [Rhizopogon vesiculosus]|uniref:Uncharacterized protein n=1 Tax=Rhizopogon vesiculosus TaxID=180088 RepID=A0A1J8QUT6_9AGAM|nr:hypothetical protein AZE42_13498 [Rhizopogon vesiculosus]
MTNDSHEWSDVMPVINVKYRYTKALLKASKESPLDWTKDEDRSFHSRLWDLF